MSWVPVCDGSVCCPHAICGQGEIALTGLSRLFRRDQGVKMVAERRDACGFAWAHRYIRRRGGMNSCQVRNVTRRVPALRCDVGACASAILAAVAAPGTE